MMAMSLMQEGSESSVMAMLSQVPGNDVCVDCGKSEPGKTKKKEDVNFFFFLTKIRLGFYEHWCALLSQLQWCPPTSWKSY